MYLNKRQTIVEMIYLQVFCRVMRKVGKESCKSKETCSSVTHCTLKLNRAVVLTKLTRLEYYRLLHDNLTEKQLEEYLRSQGTDFDSLVAHHKIHKELEKHIKDILDNHGVETRIADRFTYSDEHVTWADVIFSAGGDGTYLMAASRVRDTKTPVIGLNTDPVRSEGRLCLPHSCSENFEAIIKRLKDGNFDWMYRSRIRVSLSGKPSYQDSAMHFSDNKMETTNDFFDYRCEDESLTQYSNTKKEAMRPPYHPPILALNEAFMAEKLSARVSHFHAKVNDSDTPWRIKCSGVCASTGTGSTSWHLSMNRITDQNVHDIIKILAEDGIAVNTTADTTIASQVAAKFNNALIYPVSSQQMHYTVRDMIFADVWPQPKDVPPRGAASRLEVLSLCLDGSLVIDGLLSFTFNEGTTAILEVFPEDSLRTITLKEHLRANEC